jgi:hypothetical protein
MMVVCKCTRIPIHRSFDLVTDVGRLFFRLIPLGYRNDADKTPYVVLWKHGLVKIED